jgi:excisionase family DNA binding protein
MNVLLLDQISRDELKQLIADVFQTLHQPVPTPAENEFITRETTARKLGISLPTLNEYSKTGIIPSYRIGSRVRYKSNEIEAALQKVQSVKGRRM